MTKPIEIYKKDKWNMMHVEVQGKQITVREISDQWGEDTYRFLSRSQMMDWVEKHFAKERFDGSEADRLQMIEAFKQV